MDKIDRQEFEGRYDKDSLLGKQLDKLDQLVEEYNEMKANLKAMSYYKELDRRLKRLEIIEVKRMLDNK